MSHCPSIEIYFTFTVEIPSGEAGKYNITSTIQFAFVLVSSLSLSECVCTYVSIYIHMYMHAHPFSCLHTHVHTYILKSKQTHWGATKKSAIVKDLKDLTTAPW